MDSLRVHLTTWNVANINPIGTGPLAKMFDIDTTVDIYVISLQEIQTGVLDTLVSYVAYDDWTYHLIYVFADTNYYLVENVRLQGLSLSVFAHISHLPHIQFIRTELKRTGFKGYWGNKGGVAVSCNIYGRRVCFLNLHLAAHLKSNTSRVQHFNSIIKNMDFDGCATILSHDVIFLAGDLNFRIEGLPVEVIKKLIEDSKLDPLLDNDQLVPLFKSHGVLKEFVEEKITFNPTYKFNIGTDVYDTTATKRMPAWTDRILYRLNPDMRRLSNFAMKSIHLSNASASLLSTQYEDGVSFLKGSYTSLPEFKDSDHKPVVAAYDMKVIKDISPLVDVEVEEMWKAGDVWKVHIKFDRDFSSNGTDYLALYDKHFSDFRDYKSWVFLPARDSTSQSTTQGYIFPQCTFETGGVFRIGYYCDKMSCLLAISSPFSIIM